MTALFLFSCSDNTVSPTGTGLYGNITDRVENWTLGNQKISASVYKPGSPFPSILGTGNISSGGNFSIQFTKPSEDYLMPIDNFFEAGSNGNIIVNPANTKYSVLVLSVLDLNNAITGFIERRNYTENITENSFFTEYLYFDGDVSVHGTKLCEYTADTTFSEYNVNSGSGWSPLTTLFTKFTPTYTSYIIKNSEPQGGKWYYFDINDKVPGSKFKHSHPVVFQ